MPRILVRHHQPDLMAGKRVHVATIRFFRRPQKLPDARVYRADRHGDKMVELDKLAEEARHLEKTTGVGTNLIPLSFRCPMKRIAVCASPMLLVLIALSAQAQPPADTPFADKAIREAIASLKKKQASFKNQSEKAKLAKAITALELSLKPVPEPAKENKMAKEPPKIVEDPTKVTRENYLKIKIRMSLRDVEAILGKGKEVSSSQNNRTLMVWRSGPNRDATVITIGFRCFSEPPDPRYTEVQDKTISD
jgi:hypothetical protein